MSHVIYVHTNRVNGKVYVGQTSQSLSNRWRNGEGYANNVVFYRAIKKYGWDNFDHEVLFEGLTKEEANQKEIELIAFYDSNNPEKGYNLTIGGEGTNGYRFTEEQRNAVSKRQKGRLLTEEWKANISKAVGGENHPFYGKKLSDEHRRHLSEAHIGLPSYGGMAGKRHTEESKKKISESLKGHSTSEDTRKKIGAANAKRVMCVETGIIYASLVEAHEKTGFDKTGICLCCNGKQCRCGGYHWKYV